MNQKKEENYDYQIIELFKRIKKVKTDMRIAEVLGVNRSYIYNIKSEKTQLSEKTVISMAKLAGTPIAEAWAKRCERRILDKM